MLVNRPPSRLGRHPPGHLNALIPRTISPFSIRNRVPLGEPISSSPKIQSPFVDARALRAPVPCAPQKVSPESEARLVTSGSVRSGAFRNQAKLIVASALITLTTGEQGLRIVTADVALGDWDLREWTEAMVALR